MSDGATFRPERRLVAIQIVGLVLVLTGSTIMVTLAVVDERPLVLIPFALLLLLSVALIVRAARVRVQIRSDSLTVVGLVRTRTVARSQCIGIDGPLDLPQLIWTDGDRRHRSPVVALFHRGSMNAVIPGSLERRQAFIRRVDDWAGASSDVVTA